MTCYFIVKMTVTDDSWVADYRANVAKLVHKHGGTFVVRSDKVDKREGDGPVPGRVVVLTWPSQEAADAFYYDPDYEPYKQARMAGSVGEFLVVPGEDIAAS